MEIAAVSSGRLRALDDGEETILHELEQAAWPGPMQASLDVIRKRVKLGHSVLVVEGECGFDAAACYIHTDHDPLDAARFPASFSEYSSLPRRRPANSLYVYSLGVNPRARGSDAVGRLMDAIYADARRSGVRYIVGDGRCPSYAGSLDSGAECVRFNPKFREAIDRWRLTGIKPADELLTLDPVLRFYKRRLGCDFLYLYADFCPQDVASGGHQVIFTLTPDKPSLRSRG